MDPVAPTPRPRSRHAWHEPPLPARSPVERVGLGLAAVTLTLVLVAVGRDPYARTLWPLFLLFVLYASALVAGWWRIRRRGVRPGAYALVMGVLLLQGATYLLYWAQEALRLLAGLRPPEVLHDVTLIAVLVLFFLTAPVVSVLAPISTRRGMAMLSAQFGGPMLLLFLGVASR